MKTKMLGDVSFSLREDHDFRWLEEIGHVFCVFDEQDSGNISFGVENEDGKFFVKYAGAKPMDFAGEPEDAVERLKTALPVYEQLDHPSLIKLKNHFALREGYAAVFDWAEGECLHSHWSHGGPAKYTDPTSPYYRFRNLDVTKRLKTLETTFSFHAFVEERGFVAVDFYDGSILYDFKNDVTTICDIDFYRKCPTFNDIGEEFWGADRSKSPEEYKLGAVIDERTNVYTMGAIAFGLLGGETDYSLSRWEAGEDLYEVASNAVNKDREARYKNVRAFMKAWKEVKERLTFT
ncbi:serine/threonine protein kinase [Halobacillus trueperi]|uniref:Serine/threonine protein kinase n=1 Tax=Halobacillus trueperi TaxID=156205 RepID=A0A3E0JDI6_9BACI|nr:serine/threonine protein kinase [Halobacillus trueperi]REJ11006.1 serine/threonine protein kinase [Halobacillus trueperi]